MSREDPRRKSFFFFKVLLKSVGVFAAVILGIAVFSYPFPGKCYECPILQKLSGLFFNILGVTAFCLPLVILMAVFFLKNEKVRKYVKLSLILWLPVLINLALVRDLFEIKVNFAGITKLIFDFARDNRIDFLLIFIPILGMDLLILHLLGVNIFGLFKKVSRETGSFFTNKEEPTEDTKKREP
ncbi:MAG: hypothetical protein GTO45_07490 [Candidatus Aminicenantes bacterium]|nr:hypothetical protein [Candidatus Aminicenantes bacterium]NIM78679.1 hypothetical protein [Candidatus Aminicenantes bacterium]NIN17926.1 hypothetical protein [Candidatus Aminicenantes bacterium]NIN41829.1 hypothetical protein [Candidatus Aminicenantes bacterium]NIN84581.1 hypothetical protein [Candidatus Aminicenantes bacterium]